MSLTIYIYLCVYIYIYIYISQCCTMSVTTSIKATQEGNLVRQRRHCRGSWTYRRDKCTPPDPLSRQGLRLLASIPLDAGFLSPEPPHSLDSRDGLGRVLGERVADSLRRSGGRLPDMPFRASAAAAARMCHGMGLHGMVRCLTTWREVEPTGSSAKVETATLRRMVVGG